MKRLQLVLLLTCLALAVSAFGFDSARIIPATGTIEYAFTPGHYTAGLIVRTIGAANSQVLVQAFSFTHMVIADSLVRAHRRGVDVQVILDREQADSFDSAAERSLVDADVPVFMDADHAAAHNKFIVIDHGEKRPALITGSFNFTFAAQYRNAENVLVLRGNPDLNPSILRQLAAAPATCDRRGYQPIQIT